MNALALATLALTASALTASAHADLLVTPTISAASSEVAYTLGSNPPAILDRFSEDTGVAFAGSAFSVGNPGPNPQGNTHYGRGTYTNEVFLAFSGPI
jgi:hypothetical protein